MGVGEQGKDHGDLKQGNVRAKVLAGPSGSSSVNKVFESGGVHDSVKNSKCFFLRFIRVKAQYLGERLKVPISKGRNRGRRNWQGGRSEKVEIMKRPLNALENVRRDAFEKIVCKAVESTEQAGSNRLIIPARVRHGF